MGVHPRKTQVVFSLNGSHIIEMLVPDPEAGCGPTHIRSVVVARTHAGVNPYGYLAPWEVGAEGPQLVERTRVEKYAAALNVLESFSAFGQLLRRQLDMFRRNARVQRATDFEGTACIDVEAAAIKDAEYGRCG
jgi:hypothetical protein